MGKDILIYLEWTSHLYTYQDKKQTTMPVQSMLLDTCKILAIS